MSTRGWLAPLWLAAALFAATSAMAQGPAPPRRRGACCLVAGPKNSDQPIQIEAKSLEMRDKKKEATFSGNVKVVQGDTTMTSKTLVVFYGHGPGRRSGGNARRRRRRRRPGSDPRTWRQMRRISAGSRPTATWSYSEGSES